MNTNFNKVVGDNALVIQKLSNADVNKISVTKDMDIPHGDMPGDKIEIGDSHIEKANIIFPKLIELLKENAKNNEYGRSVVCVCGGSGVGKSEIASLLSFYLNECGIGSYTLSGDNYPHRIPMYNDAERLHIFREGGIRSMTDAGVMNKENIETLKKFQLEDNDANKDLIKEHEFMKAYIEGGSKALDAYLGTPKETDFDEVSSIIKAFKEGADKIWLKRMGRDEASLWYDEVSFENTNVLIIEWTHGNSDYIEGVDIPILLNSTPEETLAHRRSRARDGKVDSAFTTLVLMLEQAKLHSQARKAKIIVSKDAKILTFDEYSKLMEGQI